MRALVARRGHMRALVAGDEGRMLRWELTAHEERSTRSADGSRNSCC